MSIHTIQTGMLRLIPEIGCILSAIITGIISFRLMSPFFRTLFWQVVIWSLFYTASHVITLWQQAHHLPIDNQWLMNIHLILETGLLLAAARFILPASISNTFFIGGTVIVLIVAILQGSFYGFTNYLNFTDVTACLVISICYFTVFFHLHQQETTKAWLSPEKLACVGILLYCVCSIPYVSMMHFLDSFPKMNTFLYHLISDVLANMRYLLLAIAFYRLFITTKKHTHE